MSSHSVPRTATFTWSKSRRTSPLLATGTVSGALDESFSSSGSLELWDAFSDKDGDQACRGRVSANARFNRLAWNVPTDGRPEGVIAAGMENGQVGLWDPAKILAGQSEEASIFNTDRHKGTVRGLAWNPLQPSLFASGATDAEIFIWDTKNLTKPYGPSANKSRHLTDITALSWNPSVAHILATASASGSTVVWDLKGRQEVIHLSYLGGQGSVYSQGPKPVSAVCWHPERGTRVITASEDDSAPVILVWDLRNYRTPERVLAGHEKGVLSLDWCAQDPELLFSCGKDCRTLAWNPSTGEMVGELPATTNWSFEVASCPRNPSYVATASFDGKINITSLQNTAAPTEPTGVQQPQPDNAADIFSAGNLSNLAAQVHPGVSLKQPPRWLRRPASSSFGFGGKLATATNTTVQAGAPNLPPTVNTSVKVHQVVTESDIVERAVRLDEAKQSQTLSEFCESRKAGADVDGEASGSKAKQEELENWKLLSSLFRADSKDELVTLLGFSKEHVKKGVEEAIKSFKSATGRPSELPLGMGNRKPASSDSGDGDDGGSIAREPLVTFADQSTNATDAMSGSSEGEGAAAQESRGPNSSVSDATTSETDASTSIASDATTKIGGAESEVTEPSLFGDDNAPGNAQQQAAADFYSQLNAPDTPSTSARLPSLSERFNLTQHHVDRAGSSIAATIGSRPSSSASDGPKPTTFRIYPQDESEADRLLTRALVLGDFESAVSLCLSADRFADALLLAVRGGSDLLAKTQKAYFERRTTSLPYLRLFQSIISDDLTDVVQNADLGDWQEIFVVLCTFAKTEDYPTLVEQLGQRLEYQLSVARSAGAGSSEAALEQRRSAVLCYLAAGKLEKVINIWIEEMREEEQSIEESLGGDGKTLSSSARYTAHAQALQSFVEKVTVFISAAAYVDTELAQPATASESEGGARTYKLAQLYDKYSEYAELLAAQGLVTLAVKYAALTPAEYVSPGAGVSTRERLQVTTGQKIAAPSVSQQLRQAATSKPAYQTFAAQAQTSYYGGQTAYNGIPQQQQTIQQPQQIQQSGYQDPYAPSTSMAQNQPSFNQQSNPYAPTSDYQPNTNGYQQTNSYNPGSFVPQIPTPMNSGPYGAPQQQINQQPAAIPPPPIKKAPVGGWNDAPLVAPKRTGSAAGSRAAVAPIFSPFPNAAPQSPAAYGGPSGFPGPQAGGAGPGNVPPPPPSRGANKTPAQQFVAPPPPRGTQPPMQQQQGMPPQQMQQGRPPLPPQQQQQQQYMPGPGQGNMQPPPQMGMQQRPGQGPPGQQQQNNLPPQMRMQSPPQSMPNNMPPQQQRFGPPQQGQAQQHYGQQGPPPQQMQQGQYGPPQGNQQPPQQQQPAFVPPPPARRG